MHLTLDNCTLWAHHILHPLPFKGLQPDLDANKRVISYTKLVETANGASLFTSKGRTLQRDVLELPPGVSWEGKEDSYFMLPKCKHFCASPVEGYKVTKLDIFSKKPEGVEAVELLGYFVTVETEELT